MSKKKYTLSLWLTFMLIVSSLWTTPASATGIYNQDGFGYSGSTAPSPIGPDIVMTGYNGWPSGFTKSDSAFQSSVFDGQNIWLVPLGADRVIKIDKDTGAMTGYNEWPSGFTKGSNAFAGGIFDGQNIWMIPYSADRVIKIDKDTGAMTGYNGWPSGFTKGGGAFQGGVFDGRNAWLIPFFADQVMKIQIGYNVSFDTDSGSAVATQGVAKNGYATQPAAPTKAGYTFDGWFSDNTYATAFDFANTPITAATTVYAKWTVSPIDAPPQNLSAQAGDRQVTLTWSAVTNAADYEVYMSPTEGGFTNTPIATVTEATYSVQNLTNGTTYYFVVKAGNAGGWSAASNEVSATPAMVPAAPTMVSAVAGNGSATVTFTAPSDNGGSAVTSYEVTASPGNVVVTGTASPIAVTGLTNGTSYTFTVKAVNSVGKSLPSGESNAIIPSSPSSNNGNNDTTEQATTPSQTSNSGIDVLINGKMESAGTAIFTKKNGQTVITVAVDQKKLEDKLAAEGQRTVVTIPVNAKSDVVIGEFNGQMVKTMEDKQAVVEIRTEKASYTLPAEQININAISEQVGKTVALQEIKIQIEIAAPTAETIKVAENSAVKGQFTIVAPSINFTVRGTYGDKTIDVSGFNAFVERTIAIPDGVDPNKITTGVVIEPDGAVRHVPTKIVIVGGKYFARISSLTNSTYSIVWHPFEFKDVDGHWAKQAVNDMGSRMVINGVGADMFNPDQDITRAEFTAIMARGLGLKLEGGTAPFSDVRTSDWYGNVINTAYEYNLISGFEDGTFRPNDKITREQAMVMISKAMAITDLQQVEVNQEADEILHAFSDEQKISNWARIGIVDSVQNDIVSGRSDGQLAPDAFVTRAEVAVMMQRLLQKSELI